jgi:predicted lipoprotein with Yx(FWY)xxD motif
MRRPLAAFAVLAAAGTLAAGCSNSSGSSGSGGYGSGGASPASPAAGTSGMASVAAASSKLGPILVDGSGRTLYLFKKDNGTTSSCNGACATAWPAYTTTGAPKAGTGVTASLLGTTKRTDGTTEVTYHGHPLYYFARDSKPGDTNGQNVDAFGAEWYVLSPAGNEVDNGGS